MRVMYLTCWAVHVCTLCCHGKGCGKDEEATSNRKEGSFFFCFFRLECLPTSKKYVSVYDVRAEKNGDVRRDALRRRRRRSRCGRRLLFRVPEHHRLPFRGARRHKARRSFSGRLVMRNVKALLLLSERPWLIERAKAGSPLCAMTNIEYWETAFFPPHALRSIALIHPLIHISR